MRQEARILAAKFWSMYVLHHPIRACSVLLLKPMTRQKSTRCEKPNPISLTCIMSWSWPRRIFQTVGQAVVLEGCSCSIEDLHVYQHSRCRIASACQYLSSLDSAHRCPHALLLSSACIVRSQHNNVDCMQSSGAYGQGYSLKYKSSFYGTTRQNYIPKL